MNDHCLRCRLDLVLEGDAIIQLHRLPHSHLHKGMGQLGQQPSAEKVLPALENPPGDCQTNAILYAAELLFGVSGCMGSGGYQGTLVLLDPATGRRSSVLVSLPPGVIFGSVSLDASGHHVLYATVPFEDKDGAGSAPLWGLWRLTLGEGQPVEIGRDLRYEYAVW